MNFKTTLGLYGLFQNRVMYLFCESSSNTTNSSVQFRASRSKTFKILNKNEVDDKCLKTLWLRTFPLKDSIYSFNQ